MFDLKIAKPLLKTGFAFFTLSILTTIGLALDNFILARAINLSEAGIYSILFGIHPRARRAHGIG